MTARIEASAIDWPPFEAIAAERVIEGEPTASTLPMHTDCGTEVGLWTVTPGSFTTVHDGYVEYIHIIAGEGELVHEDGTVLALAPGVTMLMDSGWAGRWQVREQLVKSYTTIASRA